MNQIDHRKELICKKQMAYGYNEKHQSATARNAFTRKPYTSQNETNFRQVLDMFKRYPKGMQIRLVDDYPSDVHVVSGYRQMFDKWHIEFEDGKSVCMDRLDALVV